MKQKFSDTKNNTLKRSKFFVSLPFCFCFFCSLNAGSKPTEVTVSLFILSIGNFEVRDMVGNYVYPVDLFSSAHPPCKNSEIHR